jgi:hypothetical protein
VLGVAVPMVFNVQAVAAGSNLLLDFFTVPLEKPVTASLLFDLLIAFAAFNVLLFVERRRLGTRRFAICLAMAWLVSFASAFPLYLLLRERASRSAAS